MSLRSHKGFSLIELMIVLALGGILLALSTPAIGRYLVEARLRHSASKLANEIRVARQKAVTTNSRIWFWTWADVNYYWIGEQRWQGGGSWGGTTWAGPYYLPTTVLVKNPTFSGLNYFWYSPDGRPSGAGSMSLITTSGTPDTIQINVDASGSVWQ